MFAETLKQLKHYFLVGFVLFFSYYTWRQRILFCNFKKQRETLLAVSCSLELQRPKAFDFTITFLTVYSVALSPLSSFCMWWTHAWKKRTSRLSGSPYRCPLACSRPTHWWASSRSDAWFRFMSSAAKGLPRASSSGAPKTWTPNRSRWVEAWVPFWDESIMPIKWLRPWILKHTIF